MCARKDSRQPTFNGSFDGAHHAIVNLSIATNDAHAGLFGMLGEDVEMKDLVFARPTIQVTDDNQFVGVLAGESTQDNISNVHVFDGQIAGEADATIGGIVGGSFLYTNFNDCSFLGSINTPEASPVGGIVGHHGLHARRTGGCSVRLHHQRTRQGPLHREGNGRYGSSDNGKGNGKIIAYEE